MHKEKVKWNISTTLSYPFLLNKFHAICDSCQQLQNCIISRKFIMCPSFFLHLMNYILTANCIIQPPTSRPPMCSPAKWRRELFCSCSSPYSPELPPTFLPRPNICTVPLHVPLPLSHCLLIFLPSCTPLWPFLSLCNVCCWELLRLFAPLASTGASFLHPSHGTGKQGTTWLLLSLP